MSNIKQIFHHFYKKLIKKLTDVKIQKGSEDRFSREKIKILFKEKVSGCLDMIIWELEKYM